MRMDEPSALRRPAGRVFRAHSLERKVHMAKRLFTSESVTEGHPDKVCDQISDAVLDDILAADPTAHVACETFTTTGIVTVMGEITTKHYTDIPSIVRRTVERIGYTDPAYGFDYRSCAVMTAIDEQSPDIAMGVNESYELQNGGDDEADRIGAGDQGMMFGYACDETPELMPAPISLAHKLSRKLADVRKAGELTWLRPDGKSQVTVEYGDDGQVLSCPAIVVSTQHDPDIALKDLREAIAETSVDILGDKASGMYISGVKDAAGNFSMVHTSSTVKLLLRRSSGWSGMVTKFPFPSPRNTCFPPGSRHSASEVFPVKLCRMAGLAFGP